ncbi:MAG TPA: FlgD immunoglobulin-like domain containing protein [bacterium]|nr:FlgD immunoglobulin-like domain containing protein [bacterium]
MKKLVMLIVMVFVLVGLFAQWNVDLTDQSNQKHFDQLRTCGNFVYGVYNKGFFRSDANGQNFQYYQATDNDSITFCSAWMFDENNIILAGQIEFQYYFGHGVIFRTVNGGQSWTRADIFEELSVPPYWRKVIKDFQFRNTQLGFAIVGSTIYDSSQVTDRIYRTTNGGQTWTLSVYLEPEATIGSSDLSAPIAAFAVNQPDGETRIEYSTNNGDGWAQNYLDWPTKIDCIKYFPQIGEWICGVNATDYNQITIFHGNNIGSYVTTWQFISVSNMNYGEYFKKTWLAMTPDNKLYIIKHDLSGYQNGLARSDDLLNWYDETDFPGLLSLECDSLIGLVYSSNKLFIGNHHKIWSYALSVSNSDQTQAPLPNIAYIKCYPNPFKDDTFIKFKNQTSDNIEINVFNIKGQLVKKIINQTVSSGEHQFIWDGKKDNGQPAAAGVYFYNLKSDRYTHTGKILLLK